MIPENKVKPFSVYPIVGEWIQGNGKATNHYPEEEKTDQG
jgi:hypothetical protein